jgi:hypothetical protein
MIMFARAAALAAIAIVVALTLGPVSVRALSPFAGWDRPLAYAVIGFLLILSFPRHRWRAMAGVLVLIAGLEAAQELLPDRHGRLIDAVEKSIGAGLGAAAASGALWALRRREAK